MTLAIDATISKRSPRCAVRQSRGEHARDDRRGAMMLAIDATISTRSPRCEERRGATLTVHALAGDGAGERTLGTIARGTRPVGRAAQVHAP